MVSIIVRSDLGCTRRLTIVCTSGLDNSHLLYFSYTIEWRNLQCSFVLIIDLFCFVSVTFLIRSIEILDVKELFPYYFQPFSTRKDSPIRTFSYLSIADIIMSSSSCMWQCHIDEDNVNVQPSSACTSMIIRISCSHSHSSNTYTYKRWENTRRTIACACRNMFCSYQRISIAPFLRRWYWRK